MRNLLLALAVSFTPIAAASVGASVGLSAGHSAGPGALLRESGHPARDLGDLVRGLGAPRLEERVQAEAEIATVLRQTLGGAGGGASAGTPRDRYESAIRELRASLIALSGPGGPPSSEETHAGAAASRRRLSVILGGDDRLLGFAVQLAADGHPAVRPVGKDALIAQLNRWSRSALSEPSNGAFDVPRQELGLPEPMLQRASFRVALDPNGTEPDAATDSSGASAFDLLDRRGGAPVPIVVDPSFVERMARRPAVRLGAARIEGSWDELLEQLCVIHDGAFQLQGYRYPGEVFPSDRVEAGDEQPPARAWIHVVQRGTTQLAPEGRGLRELGAERIAAWCRDVITEGNLIRQSAAARALGVLDWPAAVHWLEQRWAWYGDVVALEGLMAAAARGRVAPSLQDPRCLRSILDLVERDARSLASLAEARSLALAPETIQGTGDAYAASARGFEERLHRLSIGLRQLVPMLVVGQGAEEARVVPADGFLFEDFERASPEGQWLRLAVAEGLGVESSVAAAAARRVLSEPSPVASPIGAVKQRAVLRQALRTLGIVQPRGDRRAEVKIPQLNRLFSEDGPGARDLRGLGLELARLRFFDREETPGFPSPELRRQREPLTQLIIWAALVAEERAPEVAKGPSKGPGWASVILRSAVEDLQPGPSPDVRQIERSALWKAAQELRALGGHPLQALNRWVGGSLGTAKGQVLDSALLRVGAAGAEARNEAMERSVRVLESAGALAAVEGELVERAWLDLAALVGDEALGRRARRLLLESLTRGMDKSAQPSGTSSTLVYAAERALRSLQEARLDADAEDFRQALRQAAQRADHPLAQRFLQIDWPPSPTAVARDLERLEPVHPPVYSF
ncbi:hypothetical protein Poly30_19250 [Planctomycetes bacterium Poly30]|uniref:Secreted protein n=1 Tax=Saltatorellus ferox TaxID=2528018 RepID=A0A518EQP9_9BACT|nr:hypothetical protein Poly30_19250 [Planctomycetes bacterium Poly30]